MEAVCAGIVLYNPGLERLSQVLRALTDQVSKIVLVDNGSSNLAQVSTLAGYYENVSITSLGENRGIAAALNVICATVLREGYQIVLTLDQDTIIESGMIDKLESQFGEHVGIVCPHVAYDDNEAYQPVPSEAVETIEWAITSGSLTSLKAWEDVSGFDEKMFIDGVDKDFCLRLGRKGWTIRRDNNAVMHHRLGELSCRKVLGKTVYVTNHPAWRCYFMARNRVYLCKKGLIGARETVSWLLKETAKVLLFERESASKMLEIVRGFWDGLRMEVSEI